MANECIPLDISNNLDRDMMRLRAKNAERISVFYVGGIFVRTSTDSRRGTFMHGNHSGDLVGVYDRRAKRADLWEDIYSHLNCLHDEAMAGRRASK